MASELQKTGKSEAFKRMKDCIGNHPYLSLVKLGLRIADLSDEGRVETIANIKNDVLNIYLGFRKDFLNPGQVMPT